MTPKEKAKELFNKLNNKIISFEDVRLRGNGFEMTRQCVLIAVDELIKETGSKYWYDVKQEIEQL